MKHHRAELCAPNLGDILGRGTDGAGVEEHVADAVRLDEAELAVRLVQLRHDALRLQRLGVADDLGMIIFIIEIIILCLDRSVNGAPFAAVALLLRLGVECAHVVVLECVDQ